jgi:hypothetical protein
LSESKNVAFFCSRSCPGDVIIKAQDWANGRSPESPPVIGGFHTPVERDVLRILVRARAPVLLVLGRALASWRAPTALTKAIHDGSLQVVSPFPATQRRTTAATAESRNRHILTFCKAALFAHASPGGKTEMLAREAAAQGVQLLTLPSKHNSNLMALGAVEVSCPGVR